MNNICMLDGVNKIEIDLSTLEVGDSVEFRNGQIEEIKHSTYYINNPNGYRKDGSFMSFRESIYDIIKIIKKEKPVEKREFKVGDKVRCIKKEFVFSKLGQIYTIFEEDGVLFISLGDTLSHTVESIKDCLELVEEAKEERANNPPLKPEDLKIGMVFDSIYSYLKIIYIITNRKIIYLIKNKNNDDIELNFGFSFDKEDFFSHPHEFKLINKVPPKIVEVEEEIPVYIDKIDYEKLLKEGAVSLCSMSLYDDDVFEEVETIELCKIKRPVKKELNWSWDEGVWK